MPELPEVETVARGLAPAMVGRTITQVVQRRPDLRIPFPPDFVTALTGVRVEAVERRAKYLLFHFDRGPVLLAHLGMSGRMTIVPPGATPPAPTPHDHAEFGLEDHGRIIFADPRRFGLMTFADRDRPETHRLLANIGPDPLSNAFHAEFLRAGLKGRKTPMKAALLDQKLIGGLGNIYVCEALFRAGISPRRAAHTVGPARAERLVPAIQGVLRDAIASGGSTLRDYVQADGTLGYFQHTFDVYDREGEACRTPGCGAVIKRIVQSGRSTFYCPACQR